MRPTYIALLVVAGALILAFLAWATDREEFGGCLLILAALAFIAAVLMSNM
ncbi:hypothetical protein [Actinomycetospora flava]|uniref:MYXO-CTERM domain-containing protein n=1 Tax=Actinomycetospora flava TaxID=3129232 RepID=A0ABU8MFH7_9PSEU